MLEESGQVSRIEGQFAWVSSQVQSGCNSCGSKQSCGTSSLSKFFGHKPTDLKMHNPINATIGDQVVFGLDESILLKASLTQYGLPILGLVCGMILGESIGQSLFMSESDIAPFILSVTGLWLGLHQAKKISLKMMQQTEFQPTILRVMPSYQSIQIDQLG